MTNRTCSVEDCERVHCAKGWCKMHYYRVSRTGSLKSNAELTYEQRFWSRVEKTPTCWNWTACKNEKGYGSMFYEGRMRPAHRVSYLWEHGSLPEDMQVDHLCRNKSCVRPAHLRLVSNKQNSEHRGPGRNNKSTGIRGVHKHGEKYQAVVVHNRKHHWLGTYATVEEAEKVAIQARLRLFTHSEVDKRSRQAGSA